MDALKERLNIGYVARRLWEDAPSLALLAALLLTASGAVAVSEWTDGLWVLPTLGIIALGIGYLLAISHFSEFVAVLMGLAYGIAAVWWTIGQQFLSESFTLRQRIMEVGYRVGQWAEQVAGGGFSRDNLMFVLSLSLVVWLLGFNAAANMFRSRRLWYAVIPPGLALLINTYYYFGEARMDLFLIAYLFLAFTLAVRTNAVMRERLWRAKRVGYTPGIRFDLLRAGVIAGIVVIALAWSAPAASASNRLADVWGRSVNPWHRIQDTFQRFFGGVEGGSSTTADYYGGQSLTMGGPVNLSNATVMYVYAPESYHYYWRSKVFDTYSDGRWASNNDARESSDFGILGVEESSDYALRRSVQQRFEMAIPASRLVYAAPQPASFASLPISYDVVYTEGTSEEFVSVSAVRAQEVISSGDSYTATSSVSVADEQSLRSAGANYPDWVRERFLSLPDTVTDRTRQLAQSITAQFPSPYDQARAVEAYLRENMTYNQAVDPVPAGMEPVDYFLFESKEGYCNYYSSAMVVMLRSAGIPARVAAGFAQGERDPTLGAFRVAESDAHSWVEAYFPGFGWIEFEPTSAVDPIARPALPPAGFGFGFDPRDQAPDGGLSERDELLPDGGLSSEDAATNLSLLDRIRMIRIPGWVWGILVVMVVGAAGAVGAWTWMEQHGMSSLSGVSRSYARLNLFAPWVGADLPDSATPYERGDQIGWIMPEGEAQVDQITNLYVEEQYAPQRELADLEHDRANTQAGEAWTLLRPTLIKAAVMRWIKGLNPFKSGVKVR